MLNLGRFEEKFRQITYPHNVKNNNIIVYHDRIMNVIQSMNIWLSFRKKPQKVKFFLSIYNH